MPRSRPPFPKEATVADALKQLGDIPPNRVRVNPPPGRATERDLRGDSNQTNRLYELVDRTLVEKPMGFLESFLAGVIIRLLGNFVEEHDLGIVSAPDGSLRLMPGLVRLPDVAFISWKQLPNRMCPNQPIPQLVPELAVEVISEGNTRAEIERKLQEYFRAGSQLVWLVDPDTRSVDVYTSPDQFISLDEGEVLEGGELLPGFELPLDHLFARIERPQPRRRPRRRRRDQ
jgi:Uma2 family endonuclease